MKSCFIAAECFGRPLRCRTVAKRRQQVAATASQLNSWSSVRRSVLTARAIRQNTCIITILTLVLLICTRVPAADVIRLFPVEDCRTAFANDDFKIRMRVTSTDEAENVRRGILRWSYSANQRTIDRGEVEVRPDGAAGATAEFVLKTPPVRDGVTFTTTVRTEFGPVGAQGGDQPAASLQRTLTLFPKNPLADRTEWARDLNIELYDPEGTTAKVFDELGLPYRVTRAVAADDESDARSILIIGEGVSLARRRALMETALTNTADGRQVIMLAPSDGRFVLPGTDASGNMNLVFPKEIRLAGRQVIAELDKRLDSRSWPGTSNVIPASSLQLRSHRSGVEAQITEAGPAWPWLRISYPETGGTFTMCGFQIIKHWDKCPTPRYLLIRILESIDSGS